MLWHVTRSVGNTQRHPRTWSQMLVPVDQTTEHRISYGATNIHAGSQELS
jgi:hypothetical protein